MQLDVPSGRVLNKYDVEILKGFARVGTIKWSDTPFVLRSGIESRVYVDGRGELTADPSLLWQVGRKFAQTAATRLRKNHQACFIGLPTAGTALASWASATDLVEDISGSKGCWFVMREQRKTGHGANSKWIADIPAHEKYHYFVPDNVVTDGGTKIEGMARFKEDGFDTSQISHIIMIDRQQGGLNKLAVAGITDIIVLFNLLDVTYAFGELGLWPKERVKAVEVEIAAHDKLK